MCARNADDAHAAGYCGRNASRSIFEHQAIRRRYPEKRCRSEIPLWRWLAFLHVFCRDQYRRHRKPANAHAESCHVQTSGGHNGPLADTKSGKKVRGSGNGNNASCLGFFHSVQRGNFLGNVEVGSDLAERLAGPPPVRNADNGACVHSPFSGPTLPDRFNAVAGIDQHTIKIKQNARTAMLKDGQALSRAETSHTFKVANVLCRFNDLIPG